MVWLVLTATLQQPYASFGTICNLAEKTGKVKVTVEAVKAEGFDNTWLRRS